jgi:hypothetical protein
VWIRRGWIWRLVNVTERAVAASMVASETWDECDLMEAPTESGSPSFGPFEIKTLRRH